MGPRAGLDTLDKMREKNLPLPGTEAQSSARKLVTVLNEIHRIIRTIYLYKK